MTKQIENQQEQVNKMEGILERLIDETHRVKNDRRERMAEIRHLEKCLRNEKSTLQKLESSNR